MKIRKYNQKLEIFVQNKQEAQDLQNLLSCYVPGYQNDTLYKMGKWDGKHKFYTIKIAPGGWFFTTDLGFRNRILRYFDIKIPTQKTVGLEFLKKEIPKLPFKPYKHQLKLFLGMVSNLNHLGISSVGSGKSLSIYLGLKYFYELNETVLILVPTIMLVEQIYQDFKDYKADFMHDIQQIGGEFKNKDIQKPIVISTWQSAVKSDLSKFDVVINDETHQSKASVLSSILRNNNFKRKLGVTGTMPIEELDYMKLESNFGEPVRYINSAEMIQQGLATDVTVVACFLNYGKKGVPHRLIKKYHDEIKYQKESKERQQFINSLLKNLKGVTVALYNHTQHGIKTWENLTGTEYKKISFEKQKELDVFFISGKTSPKIREQIRKYLNTKEAVNSVVIAQYNIMSTGINIPKLKNLVYISANKSFVQVIQSIGRVLRLHELKSKAYVYDIVDVMNGKRQKDNYLLKHFWERESYYNSEGFKIVEKEVFLKNI
jgi:superfamily II DNA or RNA helicase